MSTVKSVRCDNCRNKVATIIIPSSDHKLPKQNITHSVVEIKCRKCKNIVRIQVPVDSTDKVTTVPYQDRIGLVKKGK